MLSKAAATAKLVFACDTKRRCIPYDTVCTLVMFSLVVTFHCVLVCKKKNGFRVIKPKPALCRNKLWFCTFPAPLELTDVSIAFRSP